MASWRSKIDPILIKHLEVIIKEVNKDKKAVLSSSNPKMAQLWLAIANLSKQNFDLVQRLKLIEAALKDSLGKKSKTRSKKEQQEVDKIMKAISRY